MSKYLLPLTLLLLLTTFSCKEPDVVLEDYDQGVVGDAAHDLLSAEEFERLTVEIISIEGYEPRQSSLVNLKNFLEQRLNKPGGIIITTASIPSSGQTSYTVNDLEAIEAHNRTTFTDEGRIAVYLFFADAPMADDSGNTQTLGVAYGNTSAAIFHSVVQAHSGGLTQPTREALETTIIHHEFGHLLGLVDIGTPMVTDHKDSAHGAHCENQDCLMYWEAETTDIVANLLGGTIPQLDSQCIQDLQANGGL